MGALQAQLLYRFQPEDVDNHHELLVLDALNVRFVANFADNNQKSNKKDWILKE